METGELEYFQESLLIDRLVSEEFGLQKQAGVAELLSGVGEAIKSTVSQNTDTSSPEGIGASLIRFMTPSILFRLHPIAGVLYLIGTAFGFDITTIYSKIMSSVQSKTTSGQKLTPQEVTEIGKQVVAQEAGPIETEASFHLELKKQAQYYNYHSSSSSQTTPKIPWLLPDQKAGPIQKIFGQLFEARKYGKAKWLLGGFVIWIVKTVLAGIGLLTVTNVISNQTKKLFPSQSEKQTPVQTTEVKEEKQEINQPQQEQKSQITLKPSGRGTKYFHNDEQNIWIINLLDGSPEKTLLAWAIDIYPSLSGYHEFIQQNSKFQVTLSKLESNWKSSSPDQLVMPKEFNSAKEVVDTFASSVTEDINNSE
jgi:hypothetical protein